MMCYRLLEGRAIMEVSEDRIDDDILVKEYFLSGTQYNEVILKM